MRLLLLGGSKSGKSMLAQELTKSMGGRLYYWATMEPTDDEDLARIARHRQERAGWGYETVEKASDLSEAFDRVAPAGTVLLDSVTALLAQEMFGGGSLDEAAGERTAAELLALGEHAANVVYVCDQIFSDGREYDPWTETYRAQLALVCRKLAAACDGVAEVTAGMPKWHKAWEDGQ